MIGLIRPPVTFEEVEPAFREIFASGWFTKGSYVGRFRDALRDATGAAHVHLTTSATTALWTVMRVLGVGPGDEVVVSDFSFPATANVVEDVGARPVFADVDLDTFNMRPDALLDRITERTRAVIFVPAFGNPTGITRIEELCRERGIPLVEDAACAIGSSEAGRSCGSFGSFGCFSFHPRKLITTGEGGAITLNDDAISDRLSVKLEHGGRPVDGVFDFVDFGYNFRMSELQAAMGVAQMEKLPALVESRNEQRAHYVRALGDLGFVPQRRGDETVHNVQSVVFRVPDGVDRNDLVRRLKGRGVETTLGTYCLSGTTYFAGRYGNVQPVSKRLEDVTLTLPCYEDVPLDQVVDAIRQEVGRP